METKVTSIGVVWGEPPGEQIALTDSLPATLGGCIARLRANKKMTQRALSTICGVSRSAVAQWEAENASPRAGLLTVIAGALGVPVQTLLSHY